MESLGKVNNNSFLSGDDQQEKSSDDEARIIIGRSYDCNFCKRGFTNAQALGGHMNIHRKDKAKANKRNSKDPSSSTDQLLPHFHTAQTTTYQVYLPSPTYYYYYYYQQGYNNTFDYQAPWTGHGSRVIIDEDHHVGTPSYGNQFGERRNDIIEDDDDSEVDLELRLGNHHY